DRVSARRREIASSAGGQAGACIQRLGRWSPGSARAAADRRIIADARLPAYRLAAKAAHSERVFARQNVVIHADLPAVPHDRAYAPVTFVEVGIGELPAVLVVRAGDAEAVERVADEGIPRSRAGKAEARTVVVVAAAHLRVAIAAVLHFVRHRVAPAVVER